MTGPSPRLLRTTLPLVGFLVAAALVAVATAEVPSVVAPPENPVTEGKRVLGKILFWDEQLSSDNTMACGTCHIPANNGTDPRLGGHPGADLTFGTADDVTGSPGVIASGSDGVYAKDASFGLGVQSTVRSAPPAVFAMHNGELFWDGRASGTFRDPLTDEVHIASGGALESQAVGPPTSGVEMAHAGRDWNQILAKLETAVPLVLATNVPQDMASAIAANASYPKLFAAAFGDEAITVKRVAFAIATYERTLVPDQTPWDRFRAGQTNAMTPQQQQGWTAFQGQAQRCNVCHEAPLFTDDTFRNIGVRPVAEDTGRQQVTGSTADRGKFKVPSLRNVGLKRTFMHNGAMTSLEEVLRFYAHAPGVQQFTDNQDPLMAGIRMPPQVQANIVEFLRNGLTDPRVANETFPFDRPTLHSERAVANPQVTGSGTTGTGGRVPRMIAVSPPNLGNDQFQLGIDNALPGATATLVASSSAPVNGVVAEDTVVGSIVLAGSGDGDGHGGLLWPVPADVAQKGDVVYFQWRVADASAAGGTALSRVAAATLEGDVLGVDEPDPDPDPDPDPEPDPEPVPVVADDGVLYAKKLRLAIDWKHHDAGDDPADALKLTAVLNPRGATGASGALVSLAIGGEELLTTSGLAANGVGKGTTAAGVRYTVKFDPDSGALAVKASGLDLRTAIGLANADGTGSVRLPVEVRVADIGLATDTVAATLDVAYRTRAGKSSSGRFAFSAGGSAALFTLTGAKCKAGSSGRHDLTLAALCVLDGPPSAAPVGPLTLTVGDADPIEIPLASLRIQQKGGATDVTFLGNVAFVRGLRALRLDGSSGKLKIVLDDVDVGLPVSTSLEHDLPVRLEVPLEDGTGAYETTVRLRRKSGTATVWKR